MKIFNNSFTTLDMRLIVYSHSQTLRQDGGHEKTKSALRRDMEAKLQRGGNDEIEEREEGANVAQVIGLGPGAVGQFHKSEDTDDWLMGRSFRMKGEKRKMEIIWVAKDKIVHMMTEEVRNFSVTFKRNCSKTGKRFSPAAVGQKGHSANFCHA